MEAKTDTKTAELFRLIEKLRVFKGLQKQELAKRADITPQYYSELIDGRKTPSISIVFRLLEQLDAEIKPVFK